MSCPSSLSGNGSRSEAGVSTWEELVSQNCAHLRVKVPLFYRCPKPETKTPLVPPTVCYHGNQGPDPQKTKPGAGGGCALPSSSQPPRRSRTSPFYQPPAGISGLLPSLSSKPYCPQPMDSQIRDQRGHKEKAPTPQCSVQFIRVSEYLLRARPCSGLRAREQRRTGIKVQTTALRKLVF